MTTQTVFTIRSFETADAEPIWQLVAAVHHEYRYAMEPGNRDADLKAIETHYVAPQSRFYCVENNVGDVVGCGAYKYRNETTATLCRFFLYSQYRGCGLGKALMERIFTDAKAAGYQIISLETHTDMKEAVRFYRKHGWQETELYSGYPLEYNNLAFEKPL